MSGTVSPGPAAGQQAGAARAAAAGGGRAARRRRRVAAGVAGAVAAGVAMTAVTGAFGVFGSSGARAAGGAYHTSTATVMRRSLSSQTQVDATLGYAGSYSVAGQGGTLTWLPAPGRVIRQGQVLYRVDNGIPVVLLHGRVPAWRALTEGVSGADVSQLNRDLVSLGYAAPAALGSRSGWSYFGAQTSHALESFQAHLGLPVTGTLSAGQAVFLPSALRVTAVTASLGSPAAGTVLTGTSTRRVVTIALDAAQQSEVRAGDQVTITMPDGVTTPGVVSSVGSVATAASGGPATVNVQVALADPQAAGHLDQARVTVAITTGSVPAALVVPVDALLARASGGYAVEVAGARGVRHLVAVSVGLFDDAAGLVQVAGPGLAAGQRVVVPAL